MILFILELFAKVKHFGWTNHNFDCKIKKCKWGVGNKQKTSLYLVKLVLKSYKILYVN